MLFNLLRSLFRRDRGDVATPSMTNIGPASSHEAPAAPQGLEAIGRRIDEIHERVAQFDRVQIWRYQAEVTSLLERILAQPRYNDPLRLERTRRDTAARKCPDLAHRQRDLPPRRGGRENVNQIVTWQEPGTAP